MPVKLLTPRLGEGVEQVTVVRWIKNEGDAVEELEALVEVETDKVITEIPSPASGTLVKIHVQANTPALVGQLLAEIAIPGEEISKAAASEEPRITARDEPVSATPPEPLETRTGQVSAEGWISPLVRKIATEHQLDLARIKGSGTSGRVTKQDVLDYLAAHTEQPAAVPDAAASQPGILPISSIRRQIAERLVHSMQTAPHVLSVMEADLSRLLADQAQKKEALAAEGLRLTLTAYFISAIAQSLRANPLVNASWTEQGIQLHRQINIGMAVSLGDEGLIVPVIKNADSLSLVGTARAVNDLADRARAKKLQPDEVRGGTFTLTNHGTGGSLFASPIINQPQSGILGTGALQKRPVVVMDEHGRDAIAIRPMIYLSFVFDHRILDGAAADKFLTAVKSSLEMH